MQRLDCGVSPGFTKIGVTKFRPANFGMKLIPTILLARYPNANSHPKFSEHTRTHSNT